MTVVEELSRYQSLVKETIELENFKKIIDLEIKKLSNKLEEKETELNSKYQGKILSHAYSEAANEGLELSVLISLFKHNKTYDCKKKNWFVISPEFTESTLENFAIYGSVKAITDDDGNLTRYILDLDGFRLLKDLFEKKKVVLQYE